MKRINFFVTDEMHHDFKMKCVANGYTMSEVLKAFVEMYINEI